MKTINRFLKHKYIVPQSECMRIELVLLSGSDVTVVDPEGGEDIVVGDGEGSAAGGRSKENFNVWDL